MLGNLSEPHAPQLQNGPVMWPQTAAEGLHSARHMGSPREAPVSFLLFIYKGPGSAWVSPWPFWVDRDAIIIRIL